MKKRWISLLLVFSMLLTMVPAPALATQAEPEAEEVVFSVPEDTSVVLPVGEPAEDGEVSLLGVEELGGNVHYVYPSQTIIQMYDIILPPQPTAPSELYLELVDSQGVVAAVFDGPLSSAYMGDYQLYVSFAGMVRPDNLPAGDYGMQARVPGAPDTIIPVDKTVRVLPEDMLVLAGLSLRGFYTGVPSFMALAELEGFSEEDLCALRLSLLDEENNVVASSGDNAGILWAYDGEDTVKLGLKLEVESGVLLDADETYRIAIAYDSEKTLYTDAKYVPFNVETNVLVEKVSVHNARDAALLVEVVNCDLEQTYTVTAMDQSRRDIYGTYTGSVIGGKVVVELGEPGASLPITSYPGPYLVRVSWKEGDRTVSTNDFLYSSPYGGASGSDYQFLPEYELANAESFPFALTVPASAVSFDGENEVQVQSSDGTVVALASEMLMEYSQGRAIVTGTMTRTSAEVEVEVPYAVVLNGTVTADMRFRDGTPRCLYHEGFYDSNVFWTNFGVFRVVAEYFNGPDKVEFCFRDGSGQTILSSGPVTAQSGVTPTYKVFECEFDAEKLATLTPNLFYSLVLVPEDGLEVPIFNRARYKNQEMSYSYGLYVDESSAVVGAQILKLTAHLQAIQNVSSSLADRLSLEFSYYDNDLACWVDELIDITGLSVGSMEDLSSVPIYLDLEAPLRAGDYTLYLDDRYVGFFYIPERDDVYAVVNRGALTAGYLTAENLNPNSAYTFKLYDDDEILFADELMLEDGVDQYLYFDPSLTEDLPAGTYYLRIYEDGVLLCTCEGTVEEAREAIVTVRDRLLTEQYGPIAMEFNCLGDYGYMRYALSETALKQASFRSIRGIASTSVATYMEDGPKTLYVELSEDMTGAVSEIFKFDLYVCTDNDYDLQTEAEEPILIPAVDGTSYVLQATTEHPYARVWATFVNENDVEIRVELEKKGLRPTDGRCVFEMEIPASPEALIPNSTIPYSDAVSVTLSATDLYEYTKGETVTRSFSLKNMNSIYIYGLTNGVVTLGKNDVLQGIASADSVLTIKIQGLEIVTEDYFETDKTGKFIVEQIELGMEQATVTVVDDKLGEITFTVIVDTEAPAITGEITRGSTGNSTLRWSSEDADVVEYRVYKNNTLLATLSSDETQYYTGNPFGSGVCYRVEAEDAAGNIAVLELADGVALTENLSWTFDEQTGTLKLYGEGELPDNPYWSFGCWNVKNLILPEGLTEIGTWAFSNMDIRTITIPGTVKTIWDYAFSGCSNLTQVILEEGVEVLKDSVFSSCDSLTTLHIPASLTALETYTFSNCDSLTAFTVAEDSEYFKAVDGVLFSADGTTLYKYPAGKTDLTAYTVPEGVNRIENMAFTDAQLTVVTVPEGVGEFGHSVFMGCDNLTTVHLPASLTYMNNSCFGNCPSLETITVAEGSEYFVIEDGCLYDAEKETLHSCFQKKTKTSFVAPATLRDLAEGSLSDCVALQTVTLTKGLPQIPYGVFAGCTGLTEIEIPVSVRRIGGEAFEDCSRLTTVTYGGNQEMWEILQANSDSGNDCLWAAAVSVTENPVAEGCYLNGIYWTMDLVSGVLSISTSGTDTGDFLSNYLTSVQSAIVGEGISLLPSYMFQGAYNLVEITLPASLTDIHGYCFYGCYNLNLIKYSGTEVMWQNVNIGDGNECLKNAELQSIAPTAGKLSEDLYWALNLATGNLSIMGNGRSDYYYSAEAHPWGPYLQQIKSVTIEEGVEGLSYGPFVGATNLTTAKLPSTLQYISSEMFVNSGLTTLEIPKNIYEVESSCFYGCENLQSFTVAAGNEYLYAQDGVLFRKLEGLGNVLGVYPYGKTDTEYTVPADVYEIGMESFRDNKHLQTLTVPEGVKTLSNRALQRCTVLQTVNLPSTLETVGSDCFDGCIALTTVNYAGMAHMWEQVIVDEGNDLLTAALQFFHIASGSVGDLHWLLDVDTGILRISGSGALPDYTAEDPAPWAQYAEWIQSVELPGGLTWIHNSAFAGCTNLQSVVVAPDNEICWSEGNVLYCGAVLVFYPASRTDVSYTFPAGITAVDPGAFCGNPYLQTIALPHGMTEIPAEVFAGCTGLVTVSLTNSVEAVEENAFAGCAALKEVRFGGTQTQWNALSIGDGNETFTAAALTLTDLSGISSDGLSWSLDYETGTLTIAGEGAMQAYDSISEMSWAKDAENILRIVTEEGVTSLHASVLQMPNLAEVSLAASCTDLSSWMTDAALMCSHPKLSAIYVAADNQNYKSVDGVLYSADGTILYRYPQAKTASSYTIAEGTAMIAPYAFNESGNLETVTIPRSATMVMENAFRSCSALREIFYGGTWAEWDALDFDADDQVTVFFANPSGTWGDLAWTLNGTTGHLAVTGSGPMNALSDGDAWRAYSASIRTVTLEKGVASIGINAFSGCSRLTTLSVPETVTAVGSFAMTGCNALETIMFAGDAPSVFSMGSVSNAAVALYPEGRYGWKETWDGIPTQSYVPESTIRYFAGQNGSVSYDLKTGVLLDCTVGLTALILPTDLGITEIAEGAFRNSSELFYVALPKTVERIGAGAFSAGTRLYGAEDSVAAAYAAENGLDFAVPHVNVSPADWSSIGGRSATMTVMFPDLYEALPMTLTTTAQGLVYTTKIEAGQLIVALDLSAVDKDGEYDFCLTSEAYGVSKTLCYHVDVTPPLPVQNLIATGGVEKITVSWSMSADANAEEYWIYRSDSEVGEPEFVKIVYGRESLSWSDADLITEKTYYYWVEVKDAFGQIGERSGPVTAEAKTDQEPPRITAVNPKNGSSLRGDLVLTVSAQDNLRLAAITAELSTDNKNWEIAQTIETPGTARFNFDTTRWEETTLYVRLSAKDEAGNVGMAETVYQYAVDNKAPAALTGLEVKQALSTIITLGWNDVPDADFDHFLVCQLIDGYWHVLRRVNDALGINLTDLQPGTEYTYSVCAVDQLGNQGEEQTITVTTAADTTAPVITSIRPGPGAYKDSVPLAIQAQDDFGLASLRIEILRDGLWTTVHSVENPDSTVYYNLDVTAMEDGLIRVRPVAVDRFGNESDCSDMAPFVEYRVDHTVPAAPQKVTASSGNGFVLLAWEKAAEEDAGPYSVYRSEDPNGEFICIMRDQSVLSLKDNSVSFGKTYYYYVTIRDQAGNISQASAVVEGSCSEDTQAPVIVSVSPSGSNPLSGSAVVKVKASDNNQLTALIYSWSVDQEQWHEETMAVSGAEAVVTLPLKLAELNSETLYLRVWCTDINELTGAMVEKTYAIDANAPTVPTLTAELTDSGVALTWQASPETDTAGYIIYRSIDGEAGWQKLLQRASGQDAYTEIDETVECGHSYAYYIQAVDACGNQANGLELEAVEIAEDWVGGLDTTEPVAAITGALIGTKDIEMAFSGENSWDDRAVVSWQWNFGDGGTSKMPAPVHAFAETGNYIVTLTVADEAGNSHSTAVTVTIKEPEVLGTLDVRVTDENGGILSNTGVYFDLGGEKQSISYTDYQGRVALQVPVGVHTVGAYREGYLPVKKDVEIIAGAETAVTLVAVQKELVVGELTVRRMTLEEIRNADIDVTDPANQEVFEFVIELTYGTFHQTVTTTCNSQGQVLEDPDPIVFEDDDGNKRKVYVGFIPGPVGPDFGGSSGGGASFGGEEVPTVVILEIPGTATWLKDFFEVQLTVLNQADTAFYLDDCTAKLNVPNGLTLMDSNYTTASATVSMGTVQGQSSATAYWILRGDKAGSYDLSADFSATLREFNATVSARFETKEPFEVRQNAGLSMVVEVENTIVADTDGAIRVGLRNDHELPYYLPKIQLDEVVYLQKNYKAVGYEVLENSDMEILNSGETLWYEYIVPRVSWDTLMKREGEDFYLHDAVVKAIGGTTTLPVTVEELPPFSICADKVEVTQRSASGVETPIDLISIHKNLLQTAKIPTLVIRTYALQADGTYKLSDMDVKMDDPGKKDGTVTKESTGTYIYEGYNLTTLDNLKTYSITITASRTQTVDGENRKITRCRPVEIPVVLRGASAETGNIDVKVYAQDGGTTVALEGAKVSIAGYDKLTGQTGKSGGIQLTGVPLGYHEIIIKADGYMTIRDVINVTDKAEFAFTLTEDPDPGKSKILRVSNTLNDYSTGNVTVIPEGHVNGSVYFTPVYELVEGDTFVGFRYRRISNGVVAETKDFKTEAGYPVNLTALKEGDRIHFALVYQDADGEEHISKYTDSLVIVTDAPNFFENLVYSPQDMQYAIPLNPDKNFTLDATKFIKTFTVSSIMAGGLSYDGESFEAMAGVLNSYSFTESEYSPMFPLAVKYDPSGKLTISLIFGGEYENETEGGFMGAAGAVNNQGFSGFAVAGHTNGPVGTSNSTSLFLDFIIQYDAAIDNWNLTVRGGISAAQSLTLLKCTFYKVAYVSLKGELEETLAWKFFEREVGALNTDGITSLGMTLDEVMASFGIKAAAGLQLLNDDWASAGLYLRGKLIFNLVPAFSAKMEAAVGGEYRVLFWGDSKDFKSMTWNLYSQQGGTGYSMRDLMLQGSDVLTMTAMPKNLISLHASDPDLFRSDVFGGVHARMAQLPDGSQVLVWLDYTGDTNDPVKTKAAILGSGGETVLDPDATPDLMPAVTATETGAVAVWTDFKADLTGMESMTYDQLLTQMPGQLGVSAAFYDAESGLWSEPVALDEKPTAASEPVVISDGSRILAAWVSNDQNLNYGEAAPEYITWVLLENGQIAERGVVNMPGLDLTELKLGCYYGQFQLAVLASDGAETKIRTAAFEGSGWTELTRLNTIAADDSVLTFDADGNLYYLNNGRIMVRTGGSDKQILESELLTEAVSDLLVTETEAGQVLTWTANYGSENVVCMSLVEAGGEASEPVTVLHGGDGHVDASAAAAVNGGVMLAAKMSSQVGEEWIDDLLLPVIALDADLALLDGDVTHQGTLYPGAQIVSSVYPTVRGLRDAGGFTVTIASDNGVVKEEHFPDQRSASIHWTVPESYSGEPIYLTVTPYSSADRNPEDNSILLDNGVREVSVDRLTYVGKLEGKDTFSLTISNDGLTNLEQLAVNLSLLQEEGDDIVLLTHTVDRLDAGAAVTVMLACEEPLDLIRQQRFMAAVDLQPGESDFSDNRAYLTVAAQTAEADFLLTDPGWQNASGETVDELTDETVSFRVDLENIGSESAVVHLMVACYDEDGKLMKLVPAQADVSGGDTAILSAELEVAQLTGAATVKAFVLDSVHTPLCEAAVLERSAE